jgi:hypothetical protein
MPTVTEDPQPKWRGAPWWVLGLWLIIVASPTGIVGWSFKRTLTFPVGSGLLKLGTGFVWYGQPGCYRDRKGNWAVLVRLPVADKLYVVEWYERRS